MAIGTGVVLMYFALVLLFGGFVQPVTILVALPFSLGGALGMLYLCGYSLSVTAFIGLLMLMGIAAKNSILLVDYAIVAMRDAGMSLTEALLDAAAKRARPILMTSLAMGGGMLPIALGFGADARIARAYGGRGDRRAPEFHTAQPCLCAGCLQSDARLLNDRPFACWLGGSSRPNSAPLCGPDRLSDLFWRKTVRPEQPRLADRSERAQLGCATSIHARELSSPARDRQPVDNSRIGVATQRK